MIVDINPKYKKLYSTKKRYILVTGGRGSGKTFAVQDFLIRLLEQPNQGVLYTRYTMTSVDKTIIPLFIKHIDLISNVSLYHITKKRIENKRTGSFILFSGIKTSSGDQTGNLKSLPDITTWVVEEGEDFNNENSFTDIDDSIRSKDIQNRVIWIQNPTTRNHFIYKKFFKFSHNKEAICKDAFYLDNDGNKQLSTFQRSTHEDVEHIHTTYEDNKENLNPKKVLQWERVKTKDPKKWANKYGGSWIDMPEGVIFEHVNWIKEFPKHITKLSFGMDFGFNDPTTLVACGVSDGELFAQRWIYKTGMITKDIHLTLKELNFNKKHRIYADSADPKTIKTLRQIYGWDVKGAKKGRDSIIQGINAIKSYDKLNIVECKFWKEEQIGYIWGEDSKSDRLKDEPKAKDIDNHLWDALRYAIQGLRKSTARTTLR